MILNSDEIKMPKRPRQNGRISALCAKPWLERVAVCGGVRCSVFAFVSVVETFEVLEPLVDGLWWVGIWMASPVYVLQIRIYCKCEEVCTFNRKYKI